MKKYNVAVVGATGLVGRKIISILEEYNFPINKLVLLASSRSKGQVIKFKGKDIDVLELNEDSFTSDLDFALFSAGSDVSLKYAPIAAANNVIVVDNSSAFRQVDDIPLVVPEVNRNSIVKHNNIIANPNCSTIQSVLPLKVIENLFGLLRVEYTTYQAVSGSGVKGIQDLNAGESGLKHSFYPHSIYNNCLPHIDKFFDHGYTKEEIKMREETRKILELPHLEVSATCVRVPVRNSHCVSITAYCNTEVDLDLLKSKLKDNPGIVLYDDISNNIYPIQSVANNTDCVYVGRLRKDLDNNHIIHLYCVADNIRKGAASNAVQIAQEIIRNGWFNV